MNLSGYPFILPEITLRKDKTRAVIYKVSHHGYERVLPDEHQTPDYMILGPALVAALCLMDGQTTLGQIIEFVLEYFKSHNNVEETLESQVLSLYPVFFGISDTPIEAPNRYRVEDVLPDMSTIQGYELFASYLYEPINFLVLPHMKCGVSCIYCYADRQHEHEVIPFSEWKKMLRELIHNYHPRDLGVSGGDFFLYPEWREFAKFFADEGYYPEIPTKTPLGRDDLKYFADLGYHSFQLSLDSLNPSVLQTHLGVSDPIAYHDAIINTIRNMGELGLKVAFNSIQTKYSIDYLADMAQELSQFDNIYRWGVDVTSYSSYIGPKMKSFMLRPEDQPKIDKAYAKIRELFANKSTFLKLTDDLAFVGKSWVLDEEKYWKRTHCSAGRSSMIFLPDGKVTVCEELYWHPDYIIGDFTKQSLQEIFDSPRRWALLFPKQEDMPSNTPCRYCDEETFKQCNYDSGRCWRDSIKYMGTPDGPDFRCPFAEKIAEAYEGNETLLLCSTE